jgi:apolipoprotein N-acyltransferase
MNRDTQQVVTASKGIGVAAERESGASDEPKIRTRKSRILVPVLVTGGLLWASYFPLNLGWLGWLALVPWLVLARKPASARRLYPGSFFAGLLFYLASLQWMRVADDRMYATWIGLAITCALFFPVALFLVKRLDQRTRLPLIVTFPAVWTALEYLRAHLFTGFPWYFLSHTQHDFLPIIQVADTTGAYGVSFLVAAVNALLFQLWLARDSSRSLRLQCVGVVLLFVVTLGYGLWRLGQSSGVPGPLVGLIQGNLDQSLRNDATANVDEAVAEVEDHYCSWTDQAMAQQTRPTLLVWPETSYPYEWLETSVEVGARQVPPRWSAESRRRREHLKKQVLRWRADLLIGVNCSVLVSPRKDVRYNSALLARADGEIAGRYDKIHCVPFGEYVPLKDWLPFMNKLAPYDFDYSVHAGEKFTRFTHGDYRFGVLICYEDTDPYLARQYVRSDTGGPSVDFLLNISNDGWFHGTSEHEEHLAICRFRAIECRRAVARAVNMGISAVIDGNGRIAALPGATWAQSKKIAAVLEAPIPIDDRVSLYAIFGDWFPWTCWAIIAAGMLWATIWPVRNVQTMVE